ncbi:MAG: RNA methyltransferase [Proteobacteria bacterium]|nr:RNA methyltransferase [Pseudomonadota bacterium]
MKPPETRKITSMANPEIKKIRSLSLRKYREEYGLFVTEGLWHALEAVEAGWDFETILIEESGRDKEQVRRLLDLCAEQGCSILEVTPSIMESITKRDNAQTVLAVLKQKWRDLSAMKPEAGTVWLALEEIRDPGNLGTLMRTCDATGVRGIVLIGNTCDPYSSEAIRASMGSFPRIMLIRCERAAFISYARESGFQTVGTHLRADRDYRKASYETPLALVMGAEQAGLSDELAAACKHLVKIPMRGKADSLNVSVAAAIMLYEICRESLEM